MALTRDQDLDHLSSIPRQRSL